MSFNSILYGDSKIEPKKFEPSFFKDLQLHYIIDMIGKMTKNYEIGKYFYDICDSIELLKYRHEILADLENEKLYKSIENFCQRLYISRIAFNYASDCQDIIQKSSYHLRAAKAYKQGLIEFENNIKGLNIASKGFLELKTYIDAHIGELEDIGFNKAVEEVYNYFEDLKFNLFIDEEKIVINEKENQEDSKEENSKQEKSNDKIWENNYLYQVEKLLYENREEKDFKSLNLNSLSNVFPNPLEPSYLELSLLEIIRKSNPSVLSHLKDFYLKYSEFYSIKLLNFEKEIQFYLAFIQFMKKTKEYGYEMTLPKVYSNEKEEKNEFKGHGIYDLALVWKTWGKNYQVVDNDFFYPNQPTFFVVTGPNQGGKTTFARSLGQAVYFACMGLYVNAGDLSIPLFENIATHFEIEESLKSNSGKLKDEIDRLLPMVNSEKSKQFLILNELFTTATTHDALIMGEKVMKHFLKMGSYGIYVTHIQELAKEGQGIVSLVAQIDENDHDKRTFRMLEMPAKGYGYSDTLVKEYELAYEDLIRRLP